MSIKKIKSPFYVVQEFLSPKLAEDAVLQLQLDEPNRDIEGNPIKLDRYHDELENMIWDRLQEHIPALEQHYGFVYKGTEKITFSHYPENPKVFPEKPGCVNSRYLRKKWVKVHDIDLTGILWLKEYNDSVPLDPRYEIYGGKLEFPAYKFSLVPQRGTLVLFPAGPHFITAMSPILLGDLYQARINMSVRTKDDTPYFYQPALFPGTWYEWFQEHMG